MKIKLNTIKSYVPGLGITFIIGVVAWFLSAITPDFLNSILIALLIGIVLSNTLKIPTQFNEGIQFSGGKLLEISIVFLSFSINYTSFLHLGLKSVLAVIVTLSIVLTLTLFLSKRLNCPGSAGYLIGFGTAICGSSAIAALSPRINKNKEDLAISLAVVSLLGTAGTLIFPLLISLFGMDNKSASLIIGGSLHAVGNVAGAGYSVNESVGDAAMMIKMARVALLTPGLLFFQWFLNKNTSTKTSFTLPWYIIAFIVISIANSIFPFPDFIVKYAENIGKFLLTVDMAAIGLKVNLPKLIKDGGRGFLFGIVIFLVQIGILLFFV